MGIPIEVRAAAEEIIETYWNVNEAWQMKQKAMQIGNNRNILECK